MRSCTGWPSCVQTVVTPVRMFSPSTRVVWPTRTPGTSVIAFRGPVDSSPMATPRSRSRSRSGMRPGSFCDDALYADQTLIQVAYQPLSQFDGVVLPAVMRVDLEHIGDEQALNWRVERR